MRLVYWFDATGSIAFALLLVVLVSSGLLNRRVFGYCIEYSGCEYVSSVSGRRVILTSDASTPSASVILTGTALVLRLRRL